MKINQIKYFMSEFLLFSTLSSVITCGCLLDDQKIIFGTKNGEVVIFSVREKRELQKVSLGSCSIESLHSNGDIIATCYSNSCALLDLDGKLQTTIKFPEAVKQVLIQNEHYIIATTKTDNIMRHRIDAEETQQVKADSTLNGIAIGERYIVATLGSGYIVLYHPESLQPLQKFGAHSINAYCASIFENHIVTGGGDALGTLFSISDTDNMKVECLKTFGQLEWPIRVCAITKGGFAFGSDGDPFALLLENKSNGTCETRLPVPAPINALFFSHSVLFALNDRAIYQFPLE